MSLEVLIQYLVLDMISCKHVNFLLGHLQELGNEMSTLDIIVRVG